VGYSSCLAKRCVQACLRTVRGTFLYIPATNALEVGKGVQQSQYGFFASCRALNRQAVAIKYNAPDLIAGPQCQPGENGSQLCAANLLVGSGTGKEERWSQITQQQNRALPFFLIKLGVGRLPTGRDPLVDATDIIARLVLTNFGERHAASAAG